MVFMSRGTFSTCDKNAALYVNASCVVLMLLCSAFTKNECLDGWCYCKNMNLTTNIERNAVLFSADTSLESLEAASRRPLNRFLARTGPPCSGVHPYCIETWFAMFLLTTSLAENKGPAVRCRRHSDIIRRPFQSVERVRLYVSVFQSSILNS